MVYLYMDEHESTCILLLVCIQIANWTDGSDTINQVSPIRWCAQQEFIQLRLCQVDNTLRCNKKILPPRVPQPSPYQFDYGQYHFDVVTAEVHLMLNIFCNRQAHACTSIFNSWNHLFTEQEMGIMKDFVLT